jgi:protein-S-isoprenylcysteine O-methyltransferase Ste14
MRSMLDPLIVQILSGMIFLTTFCEGLCVQLLKFLRERGGTVTVLSSQRIKHKPRQITMMGLALTDLSLLLILLNIFFFPIIIRFIPRWNVPVFSDGVQLFGFGLSSCGCVLLYLAYRALGTNWAHALKDSEKGAQLIQVGPYRYVRHLVYLAECLIIGGCVFLLLDWILLLLCIAGGIGMYALAKDEERVLVDQFGDAYRDYIKRTGRFFPKMGR